MSSAKPRVNASSAFAIGSVLGAGWYAAASTALTGQVVPVLGAICVAGLTPLLLNRGVKQPTSDQQDAACIPQHVAIEALHDLTDEIWIVDADSEEFCFLNRAAKQRLNWQLVNQQGFCFADLPSDEGTQAVINACRALKKTGDTKAEFESRLRGAPFDVTIKLQYCQGQVGRFHILLNDISHRLEQDQRKSDFISTVSHELRSPLTSIKGSMGLLLSGTAVELPKKAIGLLEIAHRNADRLVLIINDILDLEKISSGQMDYQIEHVDISHLIRETHDANNGLQQRFALKFELVGVDTKIMAEIDPNRIIQVLNNFLSNACKFSKPSGQIEIKLEDQGDQVRVSVRDEGMGIPQNDQHKVFERFVDMENSDRATKGGTGLGLSICKAIVEGLGGTIGFDSEVGIGTTFYFVVPKKSAVSGSIETAELLEAV